MSHTRLTVKPPAGTVKARVAAYGARLFDVALSDAVDACRSRAIYQW